MQAWFVFWILSDPLVSLSVSSTLLGRLVVLSLQNIAASIGISNFFRAFFSGFVELSIIRIDRVDASQFPRIVELRFVDGPLLLLTCRTASLATNNQVRQLFECLSAAPRTTYIRRDSYNDVPTIVNAGFLHHVQNVSVQIWSRQGISVVLGLFLLSARGAEIKVRRDDDK